MSQKTPTVFDLALQRLEAAHRELEKTHRDFEESQKIKFLEEIIKEQMSHENTDSSAC